MAADSSRDNTGTAGNGSSASTENARDRRSLRPAFAFRREAGASGVAVSMRVDNLFGSGQKFTVGYDRFSERTNPDGGEIAYFEPHLFGSRWSASLQYRNSEDLTQGVLAVHRPFTAGPTAWAARGFADAGRIKSRQYENSLVIREDEIAQEQLVAWGAVSAGLDTKLQVAAAYVRMRRKAESYSVRSVDNVDLVIGSVSVLRREYRTTNYLDNFGRGEHVPVGFQAGGAFGRDVHFSRLNRVDCFMRLFAQGSFAVGNRFFASYHAAIESYTVGRAVEERTVSALAMHYWKILPGQTLVARVRTTLGSHWSPLSQLTLGSHSGLRGYGNYQFTGQRLLLVNVEHRVFTPVRLVFFRLGGALFFDSGVVWHQGEPLRTRRFHSSAGLGLRFDTSKLGGNGVFRIDAAYNFDQRRVGFILSSDHLFRAFSSMEFMEPEPGRTVQR